MRRNARLRREYLYKKSLEGKERIEYERKEKIRQALQTGQTIPTELRFEAEKLKDEIDLEDDRTAKPRSHIDDEYANVGWRDPKVCVTTSRDPSSRLKSFASEVRLMFPGAQAINRGNTNTKEVIEAATNADFTDVVFVQETRGEPDALVITHLPFGPTIYFSLSNTVMRHDIPDRGTVSEAAPHLIFNNFTSPLGERVKSILTALFPVPKPESQRVITFSNDSDFISFRHHTFTKAPGKTLSDGANPASKDDITLTEVGPRFEMRPYHIKLGTVDQDDAESEWVLRPYMNTARKRNFL